MTARNLIFASLFIFGLAACDKGETETETNTEAATAESDDNAAAAGGGIDVSGALEDGDLLYDEDKSYYDEYKFEASEGDEIVVTMNSEDFDTYLHLQGPGGLHEMNDDHGNDDTTNSQIVYTATADGEYTVLANSLWGTEECEPASPGAEPPCTFGGEYTLTVTVGE